MSLRKFSVRISLFKESRIALVALCCLWDHSILRSLLHSDSWTLLTCSLYAEHLTCYWCADLCDVDTDGIPSIWNLFLHFEPNFVFIGSDWVWRRSLWVFSRISTQVDKIDSIVKGTESPFEWILPRKVTSTIESIHRKLLDDAVDF